MGSREDLFTIKTYRIATPLLLRLLTERDIVRKGIERLEKQISQLIGSTINKDQVNIALLKKCKTVDVPAVHSAIGNIQKALQNYVGFEGMQSCEIQILLHSECLFSAWFKRSLRFILPRGPGHISTRNRHQSNMGLLCNNTSLRDD